MMTADDVVGDVVDSSEDVEEEEEEELDDDEEHDTSVEDSTAIFSEKNNHNLSYYRFVPLFSLYVKLPWH